MIIKTPAIALDIFPFSETSRIVSWMTPAHGRVATVLKGALRPRSAFLGQYDRFDTCELLYYPRGHQGLAIARECAPLNRRAAFRTRWPAMVCALYVTDSVGRVSPTGAPHPEIYTLLETMLDYFVGQEALEAGLFWFDLQLMAVMGVPPQLDQCLQCHGRLAPDEHDVDLKHPERVRRPPVVFSCVRGGVMCATCTGAHPHDRVALPSDVLGLLRYWQHSRTCQVAQCARLTSAQQTVMAQVLGRFLEYHLDLNSAGRVLTLATLRSIP